jgi:hypothetical protein
MTTEASFREKVELGRRAVDDYRAAHAQLHAQSYYPQIHDDHTPLLNRMQAELNELGFDSPDESFNASQELNLKEMGFKDKADFEARATETDREELEAKWQ